MNLIDLQKQYSALIEQVIENNGEITPESEVELIKLETDVAAKVDGYDVILKRLKADEDFFKVEADKFLSAKRACERAIESLKERLIYVMQAHSLSVLKGDTTQFKLSESGGAVSVEDENSIPSEYKIVEYKLDKKKILEDLKVGKEIPGARLLKSPTIRSSINK